MTSANGQRGTPSPRPLSALPSVQARILAFGAILVAGACGGLIGYSTTKVGCTRSCATPDGIGGVVGAVLAAGGVAVIAVLVLRAMGEWRSIKETHQMETMIAAAAEALAASAPPFETEAAPDSVPTPDAVATPGPVPPPGAVGPPEANPRPDMVAPPEDFPIPEVGPGEDLEPPA